MNARSCGPEPDTVAIEAAGSSWSHCELASAADDLAAVLRDSLSEPGRRPRVVHAFELSPEAILAVHGIARAGAILAPAHPKWPRSRAVRHLASLQPDAVVVPRGREWAGQWHRRTIPLSAFGPIDLLTPSAPPEDRQVEPPAGTDVVISTSGTDGQPRSVCHAWAGLRANAVAANRRNGFSAECAWLATLAWAHIGGLAILVRAAAAGSRVVCGPRAFEAGGVAAALETHRVTHVSLVPVMLDRLLDLGVPAPSALRCALVGGGPASEALIERARRAAWPVSLTYGLTEAGSQVATTVPGSGRIAGRPLDGCEVRIARDGGIEVRGRSVMLGYLEERGSVGEDGWFVTGDLGELDATGRLRVKGRRSSRIVTGGANVDPAEIEALLLRHPAIREACVVGTPDERWGEIVTAVVVPCAPDPLLESQLDAWARERLDGPRRPRRWCFVEDLPQTSSGKVDRSAIRATLTVKDS